MRPTVAGIALALAAAVGRLSAQDSFPTHPPAPARVLPVQFPPYKDVHLANGLELLVIERHDHPVVSLSLNFRAGAASDPEGKEGLSSLAADVITKGTTHRSGDQIATAIEAVGGGLDASSGEDFFTISGDALSDQVALVFDLVSEVAQHATFPADEVELARTRQLSALALSLSEPQSLASRMFAHEIYGDNPYGRSESEASLRAITADDLARFARSRIRPGGALLVVAGDVTLEQVQALAQHAFGDWMGAGLPAPNVLSASPKHASDILLVNRPGSNQSTVLVGNPTTPPWDPRYYGARIATYVLGGGADSRLFRVVREEKSWAYDAHAALRRNRGLGYWVAAVEVRTAATDSALVEMLHQIELLRTDLVPDSEVRAAKGYLVGSFPLNIETSSEVAQQVSTVKLLGLDPDYLNLYRTRLDAVTREEVRSAALSLYHAGAFSIVVVGDAVALYAPLNAIASVRLVDADGHPVRLEDIAPPPGPPPVDLSRLAVHSDSFAVFAAGTVIGGKRATLTKSQDSVVYTETVSLGPAGNQHLTALLDTGTLAPRRVDAVGMAGGQARETHLVYQGAHVQGTVIVPMAGGHPMTLTIDTTLVPGTVDENTLEVVIPALPLGLGQRFSLAGFAADQKRAEVLTVAVQDSGTVTVPAGTFQTYKVLVSGGKTPLTMFVTTATPHRLISVDVGGTTVSFQLVQ
ncbi:MAG TPA: pitrilysin family protein [Gemmatimonadales bacterium]|nr:pitrilysin family protein [Gemmatimonadales bacterium]